MNLDLIIKLIKLANNNPNENEANLAARKACRLIEEGKFAFNGQPLSDRRPRPQQQQPQYKTPEDIFNDIFGFGSRRAQEYYHAQQEYRAKERARAEQEARHARRDNERTRGTYSKWQKKYTEHKKNYNWDYEDPFYDPFAGHGPSYEPPKKKKEPKEKRDLKCTKCGRVFKTAYVGNLFVCNDCHWEEWREKKKE